ncbi:MAG: hypothetical protein ACTFAL_09890 [Candidatus Electronema sp. V4]|uniref:hypothetical protein n=1 Tax=Candidatus Electronema sp. V4 TaxID=3454756 RepID=UPI0040555D51
MKEERGKALPADLERFILLAEVSGGYGSGGVMEQQRLPNITYRILLQLKHYEHGRNLLFIKFGDLWHTLYGLS